MVLETFFDTPERLPNEEVLEEIKMFRNDSLLTQLLEGFPEIAVILNPYRQLVASNSKALTAFKCANEVMILGKRLGEALNCIHSAEMEAGCGTSQFCRECGAAKAIKATNELYTMTQEECRITIVEGEKDKSLDFSVHTQPFIYRDKRYTMFSVKDISSEKRRDALERIFFHDILNTAGAISGLAEILPDTETEHEKDELAVSIKEVAGQLLNEINAQKDLRNAEKGLLDVKSKDLYANEILNAVYEIYRKHDLARDRFISVSKLETDVRFISDDGLLIRSLGNLVKNALEATCKSGTVKIFCSMDSKNIFFNVQNDLVIAHNVQLQLFQRSFSTKQSIGRGIGLYSVKLIVEQYLAGEVSFVSNETERTIFTIKLERNCPS